MHLLHTKQISTSPRKHSFFSISTKKFMRQPVASFLSIFGNIKMLQSTGDVMLTPNHFGKKSIDNLHIPHPTICFPLVLSHKGEAYFFFFFATPKSGYPNARFQLASENTPPSVSFLRCRKKIQNYSEN